MDASKVVHYSGNAVSRLYVKTPDRHFPRAVGGDQSAPINDFSYRRERKMAVVSSGKRGQVRRWLPAGRRSCLYVSVAKGWANHGITRWRHKPSQFAVSIRRHRRNIIDKHSKQTTRKADGFVATEFIEITLPGADVGMGSAAGRRSRGAEANAAGIRLTGDRR